MTITCQQCAYSYGKWCDDLSKSELVCASMGIKALQKCELFERAPGTMEREENDE
jgi:hypothetical protein